MPKSLYQLLELPSTATPEAIKAAYVKTAARLRSSGAREEYEALKQAYDILADPSARARYDRQPYMVADSVPDSVAESHWLMSWRGVLIAVAVLGIGSTIWLYQKREQTRIRLEHVRIEAARQAEEDRRAEELRERQEQSRLAYERAQDARQRATLERSNQSAQSEARYRDSLERSQAMQRDRLDAQRERDAARREDMERRRTELEQRQRIQQDKRYADELERTSPRRF
jgi:curved DNA-binding protein CbpA